MKIGFIADIHLSISDAYSPIDSSTGLSLRTLDKLQSLQKALEISKLQGCNLFIIGGDTYDKMNPIERLKEAFLSVIIPYLKFFQIIIFPGNHDGIQTSHSFLTEKSILSTIDLSNLTIIDKIMLVDSFDTDLLIIPWSTRLAEMEDEIKKYRNKKTIIFAHLEIIGAVASTEYILTAGFNRNLFSLFKHVFLGHYHKHQTIGNITYVGSPNIKDFSEINVKKGFIIIDSVNPGKFEFHELESRVFLEFLISQDTLEEIDKYINENKIPEGSIIKLKILGTKEWISAVYKEIVEVFQELKPLRILKKCEYIKTQRDEVITETFLRLNRREKIINYTTEQSVSESSLEYGLKIFDEAERIYNE